jgi:eukaryotic-like serine/threonine-protein kinase
MSSSAGPTVLDKRYRLLQMLGRGGYGEVHKAFDELLQREVAVKIISSSGTPQGLAADISKLQQEARATAQIHHPNIVSTYAIGGDANGFVYLVMEYVDGRALSSMLQAGEMLSLPVAVDVLCQIASALQVLHRHGVLHRDLTPRNVMLIAQEDGSYSAKVLDFGLAKLERKSADSISRTGKAIGTVGYMSPEQCLALPFDKRSEMYTFGLLMYEVFMGKRAHPADGAPTLVHTVREYPAKFAVANPEAKVPPALENIVFRAISKNPRDRYQSFDEVSAELAMVAEALKSGSPLPNIQKPPLGKFPMPVPIQRPFKWNLQRFGQKGGWFWATICLVLFVGLFLICWH